MATMDMGASPYVMQETVGGGTPLPNFTPQSGLSFQLARNTPMQGVWAPGAQDIWNMMVSLQQNVVQLTEQIFTQQKDMYEQRKELDMLKEDNSRLTQQLSTQQEAIEELKKQINERHAKEAVIINPPWPQTNDKPQITHQNAEKIPSKKIVDENLDAQERMEREKKQYNVVISGVEEEENENARSLKGKIQEILAEHFDMSDVPLEGVHRVGKKREDSKRPKLIVCTIMDARKRQIILDNSSTYLKGTSMYINEDRTFMQQEEVRKKVAERKAKMEKKTRKQEEHTTNA